jgi:predicted PurR-regulated permease PerM
VFALDDRAGNVLTTIALFAAIGGVAYATRATLSLIVVSLLVAYLLEPAVDWVQGRLPPRSNSRASAIALVYLVGVSMLVGVGYVVGPAVVGQMQRLDGAGPQLKAHLAEYPVLARHSDEITNAIDRVSRSAAASAATTGLMLAAPVLAVFFLNNRASLLDGLVDFFARRRDRTSVKRTVQKVDTMLAQYTRAQLTSAAFSVVFYGTSTALLSFPMPIALGILGGALEFLPVIGWILSAAVILATGWVAHANWIWMAGLIVVWRFVQNFVISPRVIGNRLEMEPMTVFLALTAGGQIGGLLGVILSVPVVAVLRILWLERSSHQNAAVA